MAALPRVVFVAGKGGVGRSSVAAALGACFANRGENTLIVEWTLEDPIAPWFGQRPAGHQAQELEHRLWAMNFSLDETLREYFVGHLKLRLLHDLVIANSHLQRLIHTGPGIAELLFCGRLFWLLTLAREEAGLDYQRIIVDAPATGHGAALFGLPKMLSSFDTAGLLSLERERVTRMFADPALTGAMVVTLAEELAVEETMELLPRLRLDLGRPALGLVVNRGAGRFFAGEEAPPWLARLTESPHTAAVLRSVYSGLLRRKERELRLRRDDLASLGTCSLDDELLAQGAASPLAIVRHMARELDDWLPR